MTSSHNCTRVCVLLQHKSPEVVTLPSTEASLNEVRAPKSRKVRDEYNYHITVLSSA